MKNKHSNSTLKQRGNGQKTPGQIIVYVEGRNTEKSYIEQLKRSNLKLVPIVKKGSGIGSCEEFVDSCTKAYNTLPREQRGKFSQRWLMFDCDGHKDFSAAIKEARDAGFEVVFSNMCIEYWFLLHFENHSGEPIPCKHDSHSQAQIDLINNHIIKYNKSHSKQKVNIYDNGNKEVNDDFFDLMMAVNPETQQRRVEDACNRSFDIHKRKKSEGAEFSESVTTMHQFLETIGFVKRTEDDKYVVQ